jgi:hypothetical protein
MKLLTNTFLLVGLGIVQGFAPRPSTRRQHSSSSLASSKPDPNQLFNSPGWTSIQKELDQVPIFAVANADGKPMKYNIELGNKGSDEKTSFEVPLFYTHVEDALTELENAKKNTPGSPGMDIAPYQLGTIFQLWASNQAVIVPNKKSIVQAGAPPTANPMGQNVPLFACMEIAQENEDGKPVLPLFFELEDANAALNQAVALDGGKAEDFEIVGLNLPQAVQLLSDANEKKDAMAFQFVPPASSIKHIRDYLSG